MHLQRLDGVRATGWGKAAALPEKWADQLAVPHDRHHEHSRKQGWLGLNGGPGHDRPPAAATGRAQRASAASRSLARVAAGTVAAAERTRTTTVAPSGRSASRGRIRCRNCRRIRLRTTAPPTARGTMNPTREPAAADVPVTRVTGVTVTGIRWTTSDGRPARRPCRTVALKSERCRSRAEAGNTVIRDATGNPGAVVRPRGPDDPSGGERREWPGRHAFACGAESRGSSHGDDCSAGTCACSLGGSRDADVATAVQRRVQRQKEQMAGTADEVTPNGQRHAQQVT